MDFSAAATSLDGKIVLISEAKISVIVRGLTRSDITHYVVKVWDGAFFRLNDYLDCFYVSVDKLRLDVGLDRYTIRAALIDLLTTSGL